MDGRRIGSQLMRPVLSFSVPTGSGGGLDTQTVTVGGDGSLSFHNRRRGFQGSLGAITDGTSNIYAGASITSLLWNENGGSPDSALEFAVTGTFANSGWTTVTIDGSSYARSAATFSASGGATHWSWDNVANPFGFTLGIAKTVTFT
jgi:hypothetical protein